jgi:hypothetical protein
MGSIYWQQRAEGQGGMELREAYTGSRELRDREEWN